MRFISESSFWTPEYMVESAWLEHAPFAFWLMGVHRPRSVVELGTHHGFSYCCFCQAIDRLGLDARSFAIDTWKGDEHASFYDEKVFEKLNRYHERYGAFSKLVRSAFDEALGHFEDGSIDLLHIDGRHFYEDVKHDFEAWRAKLSNRAIVLFHDTNVRDRGFGVFRLWSEVKESRASFEFIHGHGLGVLGYGMDQPSPLSQFFADCQSSEASHDVRRAYAALGRSISIEKQKSEIEQKKQHYEHELNQAQLREATLAADNARLGESLESAEVEQSRLQGEISAAAADNARLGDSLKSAEVKQSRLQEEVSAANVQFESVYAELRKARQRPISNLRRFIRWRTSKRLARLAPVMPAGIGHRMERRMKKNSPAELAMDQSSNQPRNSKSSARNEHARKARQSEIILALDPILPYRFRDRMKRRLAKHHAMLAMSAQDAFVEPYFYSQICPIVDPNNKINNRGLLIILPIYRSPHLIEPLFNSIASCAEELHGLNARLLIINDSPGYKPLEDVLEERFHILSSISYDYVINEENIGHIATLNRGLQRALDTYSDAVLLNSDAFLFPGALTQMRMAFDWDPMVAFVNPRSNNATIATLPGVTSDLANYAAAGREAAAIQRHLPQFRFVPTAVGYCLLIKWDIIAEFGFLDNAYGRGYNEENDYIMRAGRAGYRAALANKAFAYHIGEETLGKTKDSKVYVEEKNRKILDRRYPEYGRLTTRYSSTVHLAAENLIPHLTEEKFALDLTTLRRHHNGTFEFITNIVREVAALNDPRMYFICNRKDASYHGLGELNNLISPEQSIEHKLSVICRLGQPFEHDTVRRVAHSAPVNIYYMLDTIALDCSHTYDENREKEWSFVCRYSDGLLFNSNFTKGQFARRFETNPNGINQVIYHSLRPDDYRLEGQYAVEHKLEGMGLSDYILIVGNQYPHKFIETTARSLNSYFPSHKIVCTTTSDVLSKLSNNIVCFKSGEIPTNIMEGLYADAHYVVFPSHYEGFGFPILKSLAYKKPIFCRDNLMNNEIAGLVGSSNIHFYKCTGELYHLIASDLTKWKEEAITAKFGWKQAADTLFGAVTAAADSFDYDLLCARLTEVAG